MGKPETDKNTFSGNPIGRRSFLKLLVAGAAVLAGLKALDLILPKHAEPETRITTSASVVTTTASAGTTSPPKGSVVVIVRGPMGVNPQLLVDKGLEMLGGVEKLIPSGASLLVKPNLGFYEKDATTDPRVTSAVIRALRRAAPTRVIVGDSSVRGNDVEYAFQVTGTRSAAEEAGAEVRDFRKDQMVSVNLPKGVAMSSVNVFKTVRDCSYIVNVPRLKRHSATVLTISLKNMMGTVPDSEKGRFHQVNLNQCIADLNSAVRPNLVIVDATRIMTRRGPTGGIMVESNMIIASLDPVAADVIAAEELFRAEGVNDVRSSISRVEHIQKAAELGVGVADRSKIEIVDVKIT